MIMQPHNKKGFLITFCGLDGCGKTTMIRMLKQYLENMDLPVIITKQPTNIVRGSDIFRNFMDNPDHDGFDYRSLSLFAASDRIQHSNKFILPRLEEGNVVISDRYFYSCLANLRARGYVQDNWIYEIASLIPKPDISFFLDTNVETAIKRVRTREDEKNRFIDIPLQYRLKEEYIDICKNINGTLINSENPPDVTFDRIAELVNRIIVKQIVKI